MNISAFLSSAIYLISSSLLYPTMFFLLVAFIVTVIASGSVLAEWLERSRLRKAAPEEWENILGDPDRFAALLPGNSRRAFRELRKAIRHPGCTRERAEGIYIHIKHDLGRRLDYLRILVRMGPSLGLMGTLIPMGTGLAALGQGDLGRLSGDLVIAFTTTVVGLAVGIVAYAWHTVRRRWLERDLHMLLTAAEIMGAGLAERDGIA